MPAAFLQLQPGDNKKAPTAFRGCDRPGMMFAAEGQPCRIQLTDAARHSRAATGGCPPACPPSVSFLLQQPYNNAAKKFCDGL